MKEKTVSYGRTYNLGNYASLRIEWSVELEARETLEGVTEKLAERMYRQISDSGVLRK